MFAKYEPNEFDKALELNEAFRAIVEKYWRVVASEEELKFEMTLDRVLANNRRWRETLISRKTSSPLDSAMAAATNTLLEERTKIANKLSQIANAITALEKNRSENPQ